MKAFYQLLGVGFIASTTNNFVWFALTFWAYLETKSVIATGVVAGTYLIATVLSGFWFGSIVDHHKKKHAMLFSSTASLAFFLLGLLLYSGIAETSFHSVASPFFWAFVVTLLFGVVAGNIYGIAIPTLVTVLVPQEKHDKANGLVGTVSGLSFSATSIASGLILGFFGMGWVMVIAISFTVLAILYLLFLHIPEKHIIHLNAEKEQPAHDLPHAMQAGKQKGIDIKGTILVVAAIPGLIALILFNTFNNFLGGVYMALMDAYGLTLVSVQVWGAILGVLSFGFIAGGLIIAKFGLGKNPVKTLLLANVVMWTVSIFIAIQPSVILLVSCMLVWMCIVPFIEAAEQTVIQKVVPHERQGRVFGFAQSIEQAASPLTAFLIGPITQLFFIPFMTTGAGVELIGDWFGVGEGRGMGLVFVLAGIIGLTVTLFALRSRAYKQLSKSYLQ